jgi:ankyrin repeat protein
MPRLFRIVLSVGKLADAQRFYATLLGEEGQALDNGWHTFTYSGAMLTLRPAAAAPNRVADPVCISVEESIVQMHYRATSLRPLEIDPEPRTLETGEYGFRLRDPWGNVLWLIDERSVPWQLQRPQQAAPAYASAPVVQKDDGSIALERDFIAAVKGGDLQAVEELLAIDPELVEATDAAGVSALLHAAYKQHRNVADFLLGHYQDLNLWEAAAFGREERLRHLLDRGFKVNVYSPDGFTPLGLACFFGHPACVKLLLERGADANAPAQNDMQVRPLHSAVARAPEDAVAVNVRLLVGARADVNATQQGGYTPLHQAADRGHEQVVKLLLAAGARRDARSAGGRTPADHARAKGHAGVVALLSG